MTQTISTASENVNPARPVYTGGFTSDAQSLPPFAALDQLDAQIAELDSWCSNFIGRMQPYCGSPASSLADETAAKDDPSSLSGLENRIYDLCGRIGMIRGALDEMNVSLRL